jgi:hypothetical protein
MEAEKWLEQFLQDETDRVADEVSAVTHTEHIQQLRRQGHR